MRLAGFRRRNLALTVLASLLLVLWVLAPTLGIPVPSWVFLAGAIVVVVVNVGLNFLLVRSIRSDAANVVAAHPGAVVFPSGIASWSQGQPAERESVVAVVADRQGLSFRDHRDREVLLVSAGSILSLELAPLDPRARFRPFRIETIDRGTIDFTGPAGPDAQVDAVVALRSALGRAR